MSDEPRKPHNCCWCGGPCDCYDGDDPDDGESCIGCDDPQCAAALDALHGGKPDDESSDWLR